MWAVSDDAASNEDQWSPAAETGDRDGSQITGRGSLGEQNKILKLDCKFSRDN